MTSDCDCENQVHEGQQSSFTQPDRAPKIHMPVIRLASVISILKRLLVFLCCLVLVTLTLLGGNIKIRPAQEKVS